MGGVTQLDGRQQKRSADDQDRHQRDHADRFVHGHLRHPASEEVRPAAAAQARAGRREEHRQGGGLDAPAVDPGQPPIVISTTVRKSVAVVVCAVDRVEAGGPRRHRREEARQELAAQVGVPEQIAALEGPEPQCTHEQQDTGRRQGHFRMQ